MLLHGVTSTSPGEWHSSSLPPLSSSIADTTSLSSFSIEHKFGHLFLVRISLIDSVTIINNITIFDSLFVRDLKADEWSPIHSSRGLTKPLRPHHISDVCNSDNPRDNPSSAAFGSIECDRRCTHMALGVGFPKGEEPRSAWLVAPGWMRCDDQLLSGCSGYEGWLRI